MKSPLGHNARGTLKVSDPTGARTLRQLRIADEAAYDSLPWRVRSVVGQLAINLNAASVLLYYQDIARQARRFGGSAYDAEVETCRKLAQLEEQDRIGFAKEYKEQYKMPLPHTAADVSVQRYGPLDRRGKRVARRVPVHVWLPPEIQEAA